MANGKARKSGNKVMRTIMVALNIVFYASALAGGIKLLHDLPQSSVAAAAPQTAPSVAPQTIPAAAPQTVPSQQQAQLAQYATLRALDADRHVTLTYLPH